MLKSWSSEFDEFLRDESRRIGKADSISFPTTEADVIDAVLQARDLNQAITIQGARTGITAGAVPQGGHVLNLSRMNGIGEVRTDSDGEFRLTVSPGALLTEIREVAAKNGLFLPPDPTETSASIGGMVACNASGASSFFYGPTRSWVTALRVVLSDGSVISIRRGESFTRGREFNIYNENGREIVGTLPIYTLPPVKTAAGYYVADDMDLIDLFIGMEGTLGVVTQIELKLIPVPKAIASLTAFLPSEEAALRFVRAVRGEDVGGLDYQGMRPIAIEFFNSDSLNLLRDAKSKYGAFSNIPPLKPHFHTAVAIEYHGESDDECEESALAAVELVMALGASDDDTWYATTEREREPLKAFRHAVPEAVNLLIDERKRACPELTKLGTDMSVPALQLERTMSMYRADLQESLLQSVVFGHIGDNHVHVNILPTDMDQYQRGKSLYMSWANEIVAMGGSVSAEHGIGKLKAPMLKIMFGEDGVSQMRVLKSLFDPTALFSPGNLF
ncbi:MAG: FAD-binding oxidoreductase [Armatimonadota bacterium]|nr:FAD-binding oxidoreductase [bacterium]